MNLHKDTEVFQQLLIATTDYLGLRDVGIVEKDYFVTYFLQKMVAKQPDLIFKGGTSLSKCHKIIKRFSEDIDLNLENAKPTEGQRKQLKKNIISIIDEAGFSLENPEMVRSRREFNRYMIDYKSTNSFGHLKQYIIVETSVFIKAFPIEKKDASNLIYDFLLAKSADNEIKKYALEPFEIKVQKIERTFIDKVFALGDYYLNENTGSHSRHIYDLYRLYPLINFDNEFADLVKEVREARKTHRASISAQEDVDLPDLLRKTIKEKTFEADYNQITQLLLYEDVQYSEAITVIQKILDGGYFK